LGYSYRDILGTHGPVRAALIKRAGQSFTVKVALKGGLGPGPQPHVTIVPPGPGTDGGMLFTINGGDTYCVAFGGRAGGTVENTPDSGTPSKEFEVVSTAAMPTTAAGCPHPTSTIRTPNIVVILTDDQRYDTVDSTHSLDGVTPVMPQVMD